MNAIKKILDALFVKFSFPVRLLISIAGLIIYFALVYSLIPYLRNGVYMLVTLPLIIAVAALGIRMGFFLSIVAILLALNFIPPLAEADPARAYKAAVGIFLNFVTLFLVGGFRKYYILLYHEMESRERSESELIQRTKELEKSKAEMKSFFDNSSFGIYRTTPSGKLVSFNKSLAKLLGYSSVADLQNLYVEYGYSPEYDRNVFKARLEQEEVIYDFVSKWKRRDGKSIYLSENAWVLRDYDGNPLYYEGSLIDVSEKIKTELALKKSMKALEAEIRDRERAEQILLDSEQRYRDLVEKSNIAIMIDDIDGKISYVNKHFSTLFGFSESELKDYSFIALIHPDDREKVRGYHAKIIDGSAPYSRFEFRGLRKDGENIFLEADVVRLQKQGKIVGARSYIWDITERVVADANFRESERRFRSVFENATVGIYRKSMEGVALMINAKLLEILRSLSNEELSKFNVETQRYMEDFQNSRFLKKLLEKGKISGLEIEWEKYDGRVLYIRESAWLIKDELGNPEYIDGIIEDMTETKLAEKEREKVKIELIKAEEEIKILSGLLPVCSYCKKVRDEDGSWSQIEDYIDSHSEAELSHGVCPECASKHYKDYL